MNDNKLIYKIKSICNEKNIKISTLLRKAELSHNLFDEWKNNKSVPSIPALKNICAVLDIELEDLFKTEDLFLTNSQSNLLKEWNTLGNEEKQAIFDYITALKSNHSKHSYN